MYIVMTEFGNFRCSEIQKQGENWIAKDVEFPEEKTDEKGEKFTVWIRSPSLLFNNSKLAFIQGDIEKLATTYKFIPQQQVNDQQDDEEVYEKDDITEAIEQYDNRIKKKRGLFRRR